MKNVRNYQDRNFKENGISTKPIKYYAVGEYGSKTFRPHYHAIIFNLEPSTVNALNQIWGLGHVGIGTAEIASVHYTTKYVIQPTAKDLWEPMAPPFSLISKGMGKAYLDSNGFHHKKALQNFVVGHRGTARLPRYYADKLFSIADKERISQRSKEQSDAIYWEAINRLNESNPEPFPVYDKVLRNKYERIARTFKEVSKENLNDHTITGKQL